MVQLIFESISEQLSSQYFVVSFFKSNFILKKRTRNLQLYHKMITQNNPKETQQFLQTRQKKIPNRKCSIQYGLLGFGS